MTTPNQLTDILTPHEKTKQKERTKTTAKKKKHNENLDCNF